MTNDRDKWSDEDKWTDEKLAIEAQEGLRGQGAVVEMMRRLRDAIVKQQRSTNLLTWVIIGLTIVLVIVGVFPLLKQILNQILNHCAQLCSP